MIEDHLRLESLLRPIILKGLQEIREWFLSENAPFLRSIFDQIGFMNRDNGPYHVPPYALTSELVCPVMDNAAFLKNIKASTLIEIEKRHEGFRNEYLNGLAVDKLLFLLEKYGGTVPSTGDGNLSVFDTYKIRGAKAVVASNRTAHEHVPGILIINVDLSGIQKFIYNIVSQGASKSLRSRSFFIELLSSHTVSRILAAFKLHQVNVLMDGGGSVHILSSKPRHYKDLLDEIDCSLNSWLLQESNGRLYAAITPTEASDEDIGGDISGLLKNVSQNSFKTKRRKFKALIQRNEFDFISRDDPGPRRCATCQKDYHPKTEEAQTDSEEAPICQTCERLVRLGNLIPEVNYVYVANEATGPQCLQIENTVYFLSKGVRPLPCAWAVFNDRADFFDRLPDSFVPLFARTYLTKIARLPQNVRDDIVKGKAERQSQLTEETDPQERRVIADEIESLADEHPAMLEHLAASARGAKLLGALRMDADNMGKILQKGFRQDTTLEMVSLFSRNINYFFKLHIDRLCRNDGKSLGRFVHVIYAGGDDLFALGAWNDIVDLSVRIGDAFKEYTCFNVDLGISGGFTLHKPKFPVSKMATLSLAALTCSKHTLQPCWQCLSAWPDCPLFRGDGRCLRKDSLTPFFTEYKASRKIKLDKRLRSKYVSQSSRLRLAFKRRLFSGNRVPSDQIKDYVLDPLRIFTAKDTRKPSKGFLHNVLDMLDIWYEDGLLYLPRIAWLIQKQREYLRGAVDKETDMSLYDRYDWNLHLAGTEMLSSLHAPLSWAILLEKEGGKDNES